MFTKVSTLCLVLAAVALVGADKDAAATIAQSSATVAQQQQPSAAAVTATQAIPSGPEARQISVKDATAYAAQAAASYPGYANFFQNSVLGSGLPQTAASAGSWLSLLRPSQYFNTQGGRRSSLTSRLRNIMSAIFRREQSSPYLAQGSSLSYALRQPPLGFGLGAGSLGAAGLTSGLTSGLGSSFGSSAQNAALLQAASAYQPLVIPSASSSSLSGISSGVPSSNSASYWPSASQAVQGDSQPASGTYYTSSNNYQLGSNQGQQVIAQPTNSAYQSSVSSYQPSSYTSNIGSSGSNSYQRSSSSSSFKPIVSNAYSSGLQPSGSAPAATYAAVPASASSTSKVSYSSQ